MPWADANADAEEVRPMSTNRRQQLYDRIRASSMDEVILEEMVRLGFWPRDKDKPNLTEQHLKRRGELTRELRDLLSQQADLKDPARALARMRQERLRDAKQRRLETKRQRVKAQFERRLAHHHKRQKTIDYIGEGFSENLVDNTEDSAKLEALGLPSLPSDTAICERMGISIGELRFLCFARRTSTVSHYKRFLIAKKSGGTRLISAPMPRLKRAQYWVLDNILNKLPTHTAAHGFVKQASIVSNAAPHARQHIVINIDLENFFPTIEYRRIFGLFRSFGYSRHTSTLLALLCSEADVDELELDAERLFVAKGLRRLPQGAPSSPAISNLICRRLDHRLAGMARSLGFQYTRYADDLTFSAPVGPSRLAGKVLARVKLIVEEEGFKIHPRKTRIMRKGSRREVTGLVVDQEPTIDRARLRRFRALLQQVEQHGPNGKHWEGKTENLYSSMLGFASFVHMVSPAKGRVLLERVRALQGQFEPTTISAHGALSKDKFRAAAAAGESPTQSWWQPEQKPEPVFEMPRELQAKEEREQSAPRRQTSQRLQADTTAPEPRSENEPTRRATGMVWSIFEVLTKAMLVLAAYLIHPFLGYALLGYFLGRRFWR